MSLFFLLWTIHSQTADMNLFLILFTSTGWWQCVNTHTQINSTAAESVHERERDGGRKGWRCRWLKTPGTDVSRNFKVVWCDCWAMHYWDMWVCVCVLVCACVTACGCELVPPGYGIICPLHLAQSHGHCLGSQPQQDTWPVTLSHWYNCIMHRHTLSTQKCY